MMMTCSLLFRRCFPSCFQMRNMIYNKDCLTRLPFISFRSWTPKLIINSLFMAPVRTALVQLDADYTQSRVVQALSVSSTQKFQVLTSLEPGQVPDLYWTEYEQIPWETLLTDHSTPISQRPVLCSYCIRKALIRKAQLSWIIQKWCAKYPDSILNTRIPLTRILEVDHPDYLDEALSDAFELRDILEKNEQLSDSSQWSWVLLKPSMTNKGSGIKLIGTVSQLKSFFEDLYETTMDSDIEDDHTSSSAVDSAGALSFVREWVLQQYIGRPLLLPRYDNRKFHLRVYALAVGDLSVYVFDQILALFSMKPYSMDDTEDTLVHLTNTCLQVEETGFKEEDAVRLFFDLLDRSGDEEKSKAQWGKVFEAIKQVSGEVFRAAASESTMFQPLPNAFELFGLDFVIDDGYQIYFLEANAYPDIFHCYCKQSWFVDFKQTGDRLDNVISRLFDETIRVALSPGPWSAPGDHQKRPLGEGNLHRVYSHNRRSRE